MMGDPTLDVEAIDINMDKALPRVAAIHDLSGFGRCSLTVAIPVLSAMGVQVCPIPTAILSTHSGGFGTYSFYDFTDHMGDYVNHWASLGLTFDCIYSGFLGSPRQVDLVESFYKTFKGNASPLIVVDPVMGDHGKLYQSCNGEMQQKMRQLVEEADMITPNLTEAFILLEEPYSDNPISTSKLKVYLQRLSAMGPDTVVITSAKTCDGRLANLGYIKSKDSYIEVPYDPIPAQYPGTGDIFTSVLTGNLLSGRTLADGLEIATRFVTTAVGVTYEYGTPAREGVLLEKVLGQLMTNSDPHVKM